MTRSRVLADYVSSGVTAAELDQLDTTSGTPGSGNFLRGDKTWQTAGSTSASDLDSGTLATARLPAGTLQLIATVTASGASTASFSSTYVTSAYDSYQLHITALELASGVNSGIGRIRFGYGVTPTYFTNQRWGAVHSQIDGTGLSNVMRSTGSEYAHLFENLDDTGAGTNLIIDLLNLSGAGSQHGSYIHNGAAMLRSEGNSWFIWGCGVWDQGANPTTHIEYSHSSNTFNGVFKLYGIKQ